MAKKKRPALPKRSGVKSGNKKGSKGKKELTSGVKKTKNEKSTVRKKPTQKELASEFDQALLHEIEKAQKRKRRAEEKNKRLNALLRDFEKLSEVKLPRVKKDGKATKEKPAPKKRKLNPALVKRNEIAKMLRQHLSEKSLDLIVYGILDKETAEIVFPENGDIKTKSGRFNQVLKNILDANKDVDLKTIEFSFDLIFQQDAGLVKKQSLHVEEYIRFFDAVNEFMRPVYSGFKIKITVSIPLSLGGEYYTGADDPRLTLFDPQKESNYGLFTPNELIAWFPFSYAFRLCRDWDKQNGSEFGIVEFSLQERAGDEFLYYNLTMNESFFSRYEVKKGKLREAPGLPLLEANKKRDSILEEIQILQSALPFLDGEDKKEVLRQIEEKSIEQTIIDREIKQIMTGGPKPPTPAATSESLEIEKQKAENERIKLESDENDKRRQQEIELARINAETERLKIQAQTKKMDMIKQMMDKGFTYDQIKALLGD